MKNYKECKILLVDDEQEILNIVEETLRKAGFTKIYKASNCCEAMRSFIRIMPDFAVLDVMLPDGDGFDLLKSIRTISKVPVLFLTAKDETEDKLLGLGLGADDYMVKPFLPKELVLRLTAIIKRTYFPITAENAAKPVFQIGNCIIDLNKGTIQSSSGKLTITAKEYALLEVLYKNREKIVTKDCLCEAAWGDYLYGYENTLMVHIRKLREKIEETPSEPKHLLTVKGLGYKLIMGENQ